MRRHWQVEPVGGFHGAAQDLDRRCLDLARHENAPDATAGRPVIRRDPVEGRLQPVESELLVVNALEAALLIADPAAAIIARREIGARTEPRHLCEQRVLDGELAAELDKGGHAVAQKLGHGERRIESNSGVRARLAMFQITYVADDLLALLGNADLQKWLAVINRAACVGDQPMRGAMA